MAPSRHRSFAATLFVAAGVLAFDAQCQMPGLNPTAVEIAQLPKFCWVQMGVPNAKGPGFEFPRSCGPGMNHYCPGLVSLIRAKSAANKGQRISLLQKATVDTRYTDNAMRNYPDCPIRGHVEATKTEIQNLLTIYGANPSGKK